MNVLVNSILEKLLEKNLFETKVLHLSNSNEWINHPDKDFVESGIFKNLFKSFSGDNNLQIFLRSISLIRNYSAMSESLENIVTHNAYYFHDEAQCAFS